MSAAEKGNGRIRFNNFPALIVMMNSARKYAWPMLPALVFLLLLALPAFAISVQVTPDSGTLTAIRNVDCGQGYSGDRARISVFNKGKGGVLCWYYTSEDAGRQKLTPKCVDRNNNDSYPATLFMPAAGQRSVDVFLECFEFYDGIKDACSSDYTYDEAVANEYSCANAAGNGCAGSTIAPRHFNLTCDPVRFNLTLPNGTVSLYTGQSAEVRTNLTNDMNETISCDRGIGFLAPYKSSFSYRIPVSAPASGSGSFTAVGSVTCTWVGGTRLTRTAEVTVNYSPDPCLDELADARAAYVRTDSERLSVLKKIEGAEKQGASGVPRQLLASVYGYLSAAQQAINDAQALCNERNRTDVLLKTAAAKGALLLAKGQVELASASADAALGLHQAINATFNNTQQVDQQGSQGNGSAAAAAGNGSVVVINATGGPLPGLAQDAFIAFGIAALLLGIIIVVIFAMWKG